MHQQQIKTERYRKVSKYTIAKTRLICAGLIGISIVILQDLISFGVFTSAKAFDIPAFLSTLAFALALPPLAVRLLYTIEEGSRRYTVPHKLGLKAAYWIGIVFAPIGIVLAFWHVHWGASLLVLASMIFGIILYTDYTRKLHHLDRELTVQEKIKNIKEEEQAEIDV